MSTQPRELPSSRTLCVSRITDTDAITNLTQMKGVYNSCFVQPNKLYLEFADPDVGKSTRDLLRAKGLIVMFSYYKLFFKLKDLSQANLSEQLMKDTLLRIKFPNPDINVTNLYFYKKDGVLLGSGHISFDLQLHYNYLLSKTDTENLQFNFYPFKSKKPYQDSSYVQRFRNSERDNERDYARDHERDHERNYPHRHYRSRNYNDDKKPTTSLQTSQL